MDNCIFASAGAHLAHCQPCAPSPAPVVSPAGTKAMQRIFLWISPRLCQNYPQFYAPGASMTEKGVKTAGSATGSCPECSLIDSCRVGTAHPLGSREWHPARPATSRGEPEGPGQGRTGQAAAFPHLADDGLAGSLSSRPNAWPSVVERCPGLGFWLFFKGFIYR